MCYHMLIRPRRALIEEPRPSQGDFKTTPVFGEVTDIPSKRKNRWKIYQSNTSIESQKHQKHSKTISFLSLWLYFANISSISFNIVRECSRTGATLAAMQEELLLILSNFGAAPQVSGGGSCPPRHKVPY